MYSVLFLFFLLPPSQRALRFTLDVAPLDARVAVGQVIGSSAVRLREQRLQLQHVAHPVGLRDGEARFLADELVVLQLVRAASST